MTGPSSGLADEPDRAALAYFSPAGSGARHMIFPGVEIRTTAGEQLMLSVVDLEPGSVVARMHILTSRWECFSRGASSSPWGVSPECSVPATCGASPAAWSTASGRSTTPRGHSTCFIRFAKTTSSLTAAAGRPWKSALVNTSKKARPWVASSSSDRATPI